MLLTPLQGDMLKMVKSTVSHSMGSRSVVYGGGFTVTYENVYCDFQENFRICITCTLLFVIRARGL